LGTDEALLRLQLSDRFVSDLEVISLHPSLLDVATGGAQALIPGFDAARDFFLPFSYGRLCLFRPLPESIYSHVRYCRSKNTNPEFAVFDITICDSSGSIVAEIESFTMRRVGDPVRVENSSGTGAISSGTEPEMIQALRNGILPAEGMRALQCVLANQDFPQVVVSSVDLKSLILTSQRRVAPEPVSSIAHARPESAGNYTAPRDAAEQTLATIWQNALGIDQVGIHDNFFDLGGHSFLATQVTAKMSDSFGVKLSLRTLFDSPTIAELGSVVSGQAGRMGLADGLTEAELILAAPRMLGIL